MIPPPDNTMDTNDWVNAMLDVLENVQNTMAFDAAAMILVATHGIARNASKEDLQRAVGLCYDKILGAQLQ